MNWKQILAATNCMNKLHMYVAITWKIALTLKDWPVKKSANLILIFLFCKMFRNDFIFFQAFYLIMWFIKSPIFDRESSNDP